jgi:hypothetical protein
MGGAAAVVAGAVLGALSRALMALITLIAGGQPSFSFAGTGFVLALYAAVVLPGALLAALTVHRARWLLLGAGAVFLCVPAIGVAQEEVTGTELFDAVQWIGVGSAGLAIFATVAVLPVLTVRLVDGWLGRRTRQPQLAA